MANEPFQKLITVSYKWWRFAGNFPLRPPCDLPVHQACPCFSGDQQPTHLANYGQRPYHDTPGSKLNCGTAHPEAEPESYLVEQPRPARPPQSSHRQPPSAQQRRAPRLVSSGLLAVPVAAIPLVPSCPPAGSGVLFENGPDPEAKGCYVNGLWIPASELPRTQWLQLFLLLPRPCWATPGVATGAPPAAAAPLCPDAVAAAAAECQAYRDELVPTPPKVASPTTSCLVASEEQNHSLTRGARTEPTSTASCDDRLRAMESGTTEARNDDDDPTNAAPPGGGLEDLVNRTLARCLEEARPEIVLQHRHRSRRWVTSMAQQMLERALVDARAEMEAKKHNDSTSRPSSSPTNVVDGEASRLAGEILSAAVSATAQTLREASHQEKRATSDKRPPTGQIPQQQHDPPDTQQQRHQQSPSAARRLLTSARDKVHFLADPATSPEPAQREVLGAGLSSTKKPSEPRCAEIVVHEMDDELSEAGSEDVELLGHRYETAAPRSSVRGESLATELRRCREPSPGDSGVQSQESGDEAAAKQASASSTARRWRTKLMAGFAPGTGSRICCSIV
ncbi:hypothetical protein HPB47_005142 [Ixodes persulcatus]|uniref:Uncharacterized protein n=1 Tax=Ixodes persulcatus TaxID=34615 RepID=A0AC60PEH1_IXOPE|nr:hypothetical protein HPB47_005142 [Ixodes persulcatus]